MFFREGFLGHLCRRLNFNHTYLTKLHHTVLEEHSMPGTSLSVDPKQAGRKPPYTARKQRPPGLESKMVPKADHGQDGYVGNSKLVSKVAIITGGDSGIGRSIAIAFAREGADVVLSYLRAEERDARETAS
jgi:short chain dehydrogenase